MNDLPEQNHHTMEHVQTHSTGEDELYCPKCGRRVLIQWPPNYKKVILDTGDEYAIHSGGVGGLSMGAPQVSQNSKLAEKDAERLNDWEEWLTQMNFGSL